MTDEPTEAPERPPHRWADKLAEHREAYQGRGRLYRMLFVVAGVIVTLVGIAMLVLPGPALLVIPIGLAMLAMEFAWAEHMLEKALAQAEKAQMTAKQASRTERILTGIAVALGIAAFVAAAILWDIPVLPV